VAVNGVRPTAACVLSTAVGYNEDLRRLYAILLVIVFGLPTFAPLLALGQGADTTLPMCCRRDGKHHCMLAMAASGSSQDNRSQDNRSQDNHSQIGAPQQGVRLAAMLPSERCPYGSHGLPGVAHPDWSLDTAAAVFGAVVAHPAGTPQTEALRRIALLRAHQKRGPPVSLL
jgi:hypothetical protein